MKLSTQLLLVTVLTTSLSSQAMLDCPVASAQNLLRKSLPAPLATVGQAFSVDESASKSGKVTQSHSRTLIAGPIELHRPEEKRKTDVKDSKILKIFSPPRPVVHPTTQASYASDHSPTQNQASIHQSLGHHASPVPSSTPTIHVQHGDPMDAGYVMGIPSPAHQVIRSPGQPQPVDPSEVRGHERIHAHAEAIRKQHEQTHPPHSSLRRRVQPEPPTIPGGREQELWKQPYSYGYFGASGSRHWNLQYGYRDRSTQWSRR